MMFVLCIPAYQERAIILETLTTLSRILEKMAITWTLLVAENGPTDGTATLVEKAAMPHVEVIQLPVPGKGAAIRASLKCCTKVEMFGFIDADLSADPSALSFFIEEISRGADIVVGSRLLCTDLVERGALRTFSSWLFNMAARSFLSLTVHDAQCGIKVMNSRGMEILDSCQEKGWFLDIEFLVRAGRKGLIIREIPIAWQEFRYPKRQSKLHLFRDGWFLLFAFLRIRRKVLR